ncbi:MAG: TRAP transporter large permease subunit [Bradymonadales bacterium]|nr:TRAP transporter large permease subunit [Bradymonadales bacterium]
MNRATAPAGPLRTWLATVPVLLVLVILVLHGSGVMLHSQLLRAGEKLFPGYSELRTDPVPPTCDPEAIGAPTPTTPGEEPDPFLDDLFGEESGLAPEETGSDPAPPAGEGELLEDLPADVAGTVPQGTGSDSALPAGEGALLEGLPADVVGTVPQGTGSAAAPPAGEGEPIDALTATPLGTPAMQEEPDDFLDGLFGEPSAGIQTGPSQAAIEAARAQCLAAHADYADRVERVTPGVKRFRRLERSVASLVRWGDAYTRHMLVLLILFCGVAATALRAHIALRSISTVRDDRVSQIGQLLANLALFFSSIIKYRVDQGTGLEIQHASLPVLWMIGFGAMAFFNVYHLVKPPADAEPGRGLGRPLLTIPLYAMMACLAALYFFLVESHPAGPAIYLQKLTENAKLYVQVGLYVWTGMLLKRTRIARLFFDVVRPFKLPPELLAPLVVAGAAIPTAYSGASGIFVIAAGAVIYDEMRRAGARRQLALATTAMSGSLGVVLSPCLLVVVVAALNYEVTTSELYHWGWRVYGVSAVLFLIASVLSRRNRFTFASPKKAFPKALRAVVPLIPYILIAIAILLFYALVLGTRLNEHTAPTILPILMLILLFYDRWAARAQQRRGKLALEEEDRSIPLGYGRAAVSSTNEATAHCGALLMLMGLSMSLGGVIERGEVMALVPRTFGSVWLAMLFLVLVLIIIGMIMDPYGAVILVSVTLAPIAYASGINPLHFWLVVLAAFELGYLTPPVALNQLLTRQVVRAEPEEEAAERLERSFWHRHEHLVLPLTVMALRLLLVGLVPLFFL